MGCFWSSPNQSRAVLYQVGDDAGVTEATADLPADTIKTDSLDPQDYMLSNLKSQFKLKLPGSLDGQQFIIDNCQACSQCMCVQTFQYMTFKIKTQLQDCDIYLLDHTAAVTVDDCSNCRILTGPVASSIFLRDCQGCTFITTCQQFRTRDCHDCKVMLFCRTKPIIESSSRLQFSCLDVSYEAYEGQLQCISLSKWQNFWSDVYDFTDAPDNWTISPEAVHGLQMLAPVPAEAAELLSSATAEVVPRTAGQQTTANFASFLFVLFVTDAHTAATKLLLATPQEEATLLRANEAQMDRSTATALVECAGWEQQAGEIMQKGTCVGLEFGGQDCSQVQNLALQAGGLLSTSCQAAEIFRFHGLGK